MKRDDRFVTSSIELREVGQASFFNGAHVKNRMDKVREAILEMRSNWNLYDTYARRLETKLGSARAALVIPPGVRKDDVEALDARLRTLLRQHRDWCDRPGVRLDTDTRYEALRIYTSDLGYGLFQQLAKSVFRRVPTPDQTELITATFLIELVTIDLYNYVAAEVDRYNFEGVVYRGIKLDPADLEALAVAARNPELGERYFSIPLGLDSSSRSSARARRFLRPDPKVPDGSFVPTLMKIHVCGLGDALLEPYRKAYPTSVVSTICATDVQALSDLPEEQEVLLRGPFFQLLRVDRQEVDGQSSYVIEAMMLNSNRDHFTTPQTGSDDSARKLFGSLVALRRNQFCRDFCADNDLPGDKQLYDRALGDARATYRATTGALSPL